MSLLYKVISNKDCYSLVLYFDREHCDAVRGQDSNFVKV